MGTHRRPCCRMQLFWTRQDSTTLPTTRTQSQRVLEITTQLLVSMFLDDFYGQPEAGNLKAAG
jgi:hypothetical protein